jgi:hypothetical protein
MVFFFLNFYVWTWFGIEAFFALANGPRTWGFPGFVR